MPSSLVLQAVGRSLRDILNKGLASAELDSLTKLTEDLAAIDNDIFHLEFSNFSLPELIDNVEIYLASQKITSLIEIDRNYSLLRRGDFKSLQVVLANLMEVVAKFSNNSTLGIEANTQQNKVNIFITAQNPITALQQEWNDIFSLKRFPNCLNEYSFLRLVLALKLANLLRIRIDSIILGKLELNLELYEADTDLPFSKYINGRVIFLADCNNPHSGRIETFMKNWGIDFSWVKTAVAALREIIEAQQKGQPFNTMLLINEAPDITTGQMRDILKSLPELANIGIIQLSSLGKVDTPSGISVLELPITQSNLFDCLQQTMNSSKTISGNEDKIEMDVLLNKNHINELLQDFGAEDFIDLLRAFFAEAQDRMQNLKEIGLRKDFEALEHEAHTLKGSSANLGLAHLSEQAAAVVLACREGRLDDAIAAIPSVEPALHLCEKAIKEFLNFE